MLTGRALVAVPKDDFKVFLTWRYLSQDAPETRFEVYRSSGKSESSNQHKLVEVVEESTNCIDDPGKGKFSYYVKPVGGGLEGVQSNVFHVETLAKGRDWVEILPAMKGKHLQFSDRHFADTDGDGELEFITYSPQVPSYRGGAVKQSFKIQVFRLLDDDEPKWSFDTGMGTQTIPFKEGDRRMDWDYEWTFKPVAWDIDGDGKAEIITLAKIEDKYQYVIIKDAGEDYEIMYQFDSPVPVGVDDEVRSGNNNRHFPFFARLHPDKCSFVLQGGTYTHWEMWAWTWNAGKQKLELSWYIDSEDDDFEGNHSSAHTILVMDMDGDGLDEICNGATIINNDGTILWSANEVFGENCHIDGLVIDDIDPNNPGLEIMMNEEKRMFVFPSGFSNVYALFDLKTGRVIWQKEAPGIHLQLNVVADITGNKGLDIIGTYGGHKPVGGYACTFDGKDIPYPFQEFPINGDRIWAMDWDGKNGHQVCLNFTKIYGKGGKLLKEITFNNAPEGEIIPWNEHYLYMHWCNVDIIGDHRENLLVQMKDGCIRAFLNNEPIGFRKPCKWQNHAYQMMQAPGDYRYYAAVLHRNKNDA